MEVCAQWNQGTILGATNELNVITQGERLYSAHSPQHGVKIDAKINAIWHPSLAVHAT